MTENRVDIVLPGVNVELTLKACLESVVRNSFKEIGIFYVDGGSTDGSIEIALCFSQVTVIERQLKHPTPGLQRNLGWRTGNAPFVQFIDSDTVLDPRWLEKALTVMRNGVGAVRGNRREMHPDASLFNWIGNLEWNAEPGECDSFGGDVLIRREVLDQCGGYDEGLVGGEDPELAQRVRQAGWKIIQLAEPMTEHDLAMTTLKQYFKRSYRTGYGYAAVFARHALRSKGFWLTEIRRIVVRGGGFVLFFGLGLLGAFWHPAALLAFAPALFLLLFPRILRVNYFAQAKRLSYQEAKTYAWHCSLTVLPQFYGVTRFFIGTFIFNCPLKNKRQKIKTGQF